jgi:adenine deaminase
MNEYFVQGNLVDVHTRKIYPARIEISNNIIKRIIEEKDVFDSFILPGLIDSHLHIESSMLSPQGFAEIAVGHGTVGVVCDPHEIANVSGVYGIDYMVESSSTVPLKFFFGAPSCVPATKFDSSGAALDSEAIKFLLMRNDIYFLAEVMNYPGVINNDVEVKKKIKHAIDFDKPIDGHAPGLRGPDLRKYIKAGIGTDHECINIEEAEEKIKLGMKIQIREGSAARGFDKFFPLISKYPDSVMLCSDDKHPDDLIKGYINDLLRRGIEKKVDLFDMLRAATVNPVIHYNLPVGLLRSGDYADFVVVDNLKNFKVKETYINGFKVFSNGRTFFDRSAVEFKCDFRTNHISVGDLLVPARGKNIKVIGVVDGELYTKAETAKAKIINGFIEPDIKKDICKIVVTNRYSDKLPFAGFIRGFGLQKGAIAGSVAHDSHNIIAVGVDDTSISEAINTIIDMKGGLVVVSDQKIYRLRLEIGGLMTNREAGVVAREYAELESSAKELGSNLSSPFMSLSFMALLVIPELKISDTGLFDVNRFGLTSLYA